MERPSWVKLVGNWTDDQLEPLPTTWQESAILETTEIPCKHVLRNKLTPLPSKTIIIDFNKSSNYDQRKSEKLTFIDTHCHLDFLFNQNKFIGLYSDFCKKSNYPSSYEGCIAIFCNPLTFVMKSTWMKFLHEPNVWGAFGCHPNYADKYNDNVEMYLKIALQNSKVVALGEIGLDYSHKYGDVDHDIQKNVFRRQIKIALDLSLPLVIHSRDSTKDSLDILKESVPRDYKIHRHCFTGYWVEAKTWLDEFPNLCLGFTNLVTYSTAKEVHEVVKRIPLDRLLLETDAPYFAPKTDTKIKALSNPSMAINVANAIASLRDVNVDEILRHARANTKRIYSI